MLEEILFGLKFTGYGLLTTAALAFVVGYLYNNYKEGENLNE